MWKPLLLALTLILIISCQNAFAQKQSEKTEQRTYYKAYILRHEAIHKHKGISKKTRVKKWVWKYYVINKNDSLYAVVYFPKDTSNWEEKHKNYRFWKSMDGNTVYTNSWDGKVIKKTQIYRRIKNDTTILVSDTVKERIKGDSLNWHYRQDYNIYMGWHYYLQGFKIQKLQLVEQIDKFTYNDPDSKYYILFKIYFNNDYLLPVSYTGYRVYKKRFLYHKRLYVKHIMVSGPKEGN